MRASKGSAFEREIAKQLSLWWTQGPNPRSDVFWRTSQSGGRATSRAKKGQSTVNAHGDLAAVDPIGQPFLDKFTLELKRGNSHGTIADLLDADGATELPIQCTLRQAIRSHKETKSQGWMVIHKRDRKLPLIYASAESFVSTLEDKRPVPLDWARFRLKLPYLKERTTFFVCSLAAFFEVVDPYADFWNRADPRPA